MTLRSIAAVTLLLAAACATAPPPAPVAAPAPQPAPAVPAPAAAADLVDHAGDSPETAVEVPKDAKDEGVDFENRWIFNRFGRFRRQKWGLAHKDERRYDVITVELADHTTRTVYFDITEMWNAWKPTSP